MPHIDPGVLDDILEDLAGKASGDGIRTKLRNLHEVCRAMVLDGNVKPTVPSVVSAYGKSFGPSLSESSLRNKRGGGNPYNALYRAWADYAAGKAGGRNRAGEFVSADELALIPDHDLRHRIALTVADNHHLRSRVNILEAVDKERVIVVEGLAPFDHARRPRVAATAPDEQDLAEIRDFLDQFQARGLVRRADRAMTTDDGRLIADPGFLDALERVVAGRR